MVFVLVSDPVAQGFADNLTKSGGNLTGFSRYEFSIGGKWLGLLKEISSGRAGCGVVQPRDVAAVQILRTCDLDRRVIARRAGARRRGARLCRQRPRRRAQPCDEIPPSHP